MASGEKGSLAGNVRYEYSCIEIDCYWKKNTMLHRMWVIQFQRSPPVSMAQSFLISIK